MDIDAFVSGIGVNTHLDATTSPYGNVALVHASLAYLGISMIRDHAYGDVDLSADTALAAIGVTFDLILDDDAKAEIDSLVTLAPAIRYFEGPNEVDYQPVLTNGIADPVLAAIAEQQSVQAAIRATPAVATIPLLAESMADPSSLSTYRGNLAYADRANLHAYAVQGQSPRSVLSADLAVANSLSALPVGVTETGYFTMPSDPAGDGVDETVQAKLTLDTLFDAASLGLAPTILYELLDEAADPGQTDPELHYGLFHVDGTPKLAATALHDLTTTLAAADATPGLTPSLSLTAIGLPATGHVLVLNAAAGLAVIAVWAEPQIWDATNHAEIVAPLVMTTIDFGTRVASAVVVDPLLGTSATDVEADVSSVTIGLTDHPILIAVSAEPTPAGRPIVGPPTVASPPTGASPTSGTGSTAGTATDRTIGVYRFFDTRYGTHFYTADAAEAQTVAQTRSDLVAEGSGLDAIASAGADPLAVPVYRFFDTRFGTHFFTASATERDTILAIRADLTYEPGSVFYEHAAAQPGDTPVYRFFDEIHGTHFYTDSASERATIVATRPDLVAEGIGFYEPPSNPG